MGLTSANYGDNINYSVTVNGKMLDNWKLFYISPDTNDIFMIYGDYLPAECLPKISGLGSYDASYPYGAGWNRAPSIQTNWQEHRTLFKAQQYTLNSSYGNSRAVSALLNTENWTNFVNSEYADLAIGSPTAEMWCASWNEKGYKNLTTQINTYGYMVNDQTISSDVNLREDIGYDDTLYFPYKEELSKCMGYYFASPGSHDELDIGGVYYGGAIWNPFYQVEYGGNTFSLRPVVHVKAGTKLIKNEQTGVLELQKEGTTIQGDVTIKKQETGTNIGLPSAVIEIYDHQGNVMTDTNGNPIRLTTNENGMVTFKATPGTYQYKEVIAPDGYQLNNTMYTFTVADNGTVTFADDTNGIIYNEKISSGTGEGNEGGTTGGGSQGGTTGGETTIQGDVTIKKQETGTNIGLPGAVIEIYDHQGNVMTDTNGNPIRLTTNENGMITFKATPGTYQYKEVIAPEGYQLNNTVYTFTVADNGTVTFADDTNGIIYNEKISSGTGEGNQGGTTGGENQGGTTGGENQGGTTGGGNQGGTTGGGNQGGTTGGGNQGGTTGGENQGGTTGGGNQGGTTGGGNQGGTTQGGNQGGTTGGGNQGGTTGGENQGGTTGGGNQGGITGGGNQGGITGGGNQGGTTGGGNQGGTTGGGNQTGTTSGTKQNGTNSGTNSGNQENATIPQTGDESIFIILAAIGIAIAGIYFKTNIKEDI